MIGFTILLHNARNGAIRSICGIPMQGSKDSGDGLWSAHLTQDLAGAAPSDLAVAIKYMRHNQPEPKNGILKTNS